MTLSASALRKNIYRLLDHILETGESIEITRKGKKFKIIEVKEKSPIERLIKREGVLNDKIDLIETGDWMDETIKEWKSLGLI